MTDWIRGYNLLVKFIEFTKHWVIFVQTHPSFSIVADIYPDIYQKANDVLTYLLMINRCTRFDIDKSTNELKRDFRSFREKKHVGNVLYFQKNIILAESEKKYETYWNGFQMRDHLCGNFHNERKKRLLFWTWNQLQRNRWRKKTNSRSKNNLFRFFCKNFSARFLSRFLLSPSLSFPSKICSSNHFSLLTWLVSHQIQHHRIQTAVSVVFVSALIFEVAVAVLRAPSLADRESFDTAR